ncbi:hypothetical protein HMPREF1484_01535 [Dermabacter sp. HFH0086]|uniref:sugar phosphate isomerase/epimerase family protein n=1 Tax=Dermabacter TaxID=36739 RepID=UPI000352B297|nr:MULTISPECIES: sugar phosphate isomerase/epimerase [Dermabacter]EPH14238.1 hypothetical protein HMPREF1484_01535 [Dermabacter sp. HFH0086]MDU4922396.1 sugar phosphate isomerase/epimerase [Dermabacter sp.]
MTTSDKSGNGRKVFTRKNQARKNSRAWRERSRAGVGPSASHSNDGAGRTETSEAAHPRTCAGRTIPIGLSTSSLFPLGLEDTFKAARETGYDGVEVMCSLDPATRDAMRLETLTRVYDLPILSLHAPTLFFLQFAGGLDPKKKLEDTMRLAVDLGVPTVVAHPPFRWQGRYAKNFVEIVAELEERYGIALAVENMYPWRLGVREALPYYPDHDPTDEDYAHLTIDLSHASTAGDDALAMIERVGDRLSHLHLTDGSGHTLRDEHLVPGEGDQPVAEILQRLARRGWGGSVIVEIATGTSRNFDAKLAPIERSLVVARRELSHV